MVYFSCLVSDKRMADTEAGGSGVDATTEPKDDRVPEKLFPDKAKPESQNIM